ncbi:uncharacterized protein LOC141879853 isoform X2 [Acropora palmata]|uniref:uncharacterized protein LOC141879853 isoform X2 n=1 Tax=Acropora palmata TaxID=6131 RepID=UPI003DA06A58
MSRDPNQPAICSRSCNGENTTGLCGKHSVNETTRKHCCVEEGVVVGQDWCGDLPPAKEKNVLHWLAVPARNATKIT